MRIAGTIALALALAACAATANGSGAPETAAAPQTAADAGGEPYHVREAMLNEVNPAIMVIWDVGNNAMGETGGLDPALMDDTRWNALAEASAALEQAGHAMAAAGPLRAAREGNWATEDYEVSMDKVQAALDADPDGFRRFAAEFSESVAALGAAAQARDIAAASDLVAGMDGECAACHVQYWYGE